MNTAIEITPAWVRENCRDTDAFFLDCNAQLRRACAISRVSGDGKLSSEEVESLLRAQERAFLEMIQAKVQEAVA